MASFKSTGVGGGGAFYGPTVSPHDPQVMFVTCDMSEMFYSSDGGKSWSVIDHRELQGKPQTEVQFTSDALVLYACRTGVDADFKPSSYPVKSLDGGKTWPAAPGWPPPAWPSSWATALSHAPTKVFADPSRTDRYLVATPSELVLVVGTTPTVVYNFVTTGLDGRVAGVLWDGADLYVGTNQGLLYSAGGQPFTKLATSLDAVSPTQYLMSFAGARSGGKLVFFGVTVVKRATQNGPQPPFANDLTEAFYPAYAGVYRLDYVPGATQQVWTSVTSGLAASDKPGLVAMRRDDVGVVYLAAMGQGATTTRVYKGDGSTWTSVLTSNVTTGWGGTSTAALPTAPAPTGTQYQPAVGNESFVNSSTPCGLSVSPKDSRHVLVTDKACLHESRDGGATFTQLYVDPSTQNPPGKVPAGRAYRSVGLEPTVCFWVDREPSGALRVAYNDVAMARSPGDGSWVLGREHWALPIDSVDPVSGRTRTVAGDIGQVRRDANGVPFALQFQLAAPASGPYLETNTITESFLQDVNKSKGGLFRLSGDVWLPVTTGWGQAIATWFVFDGARMYVSVAHTGATIGGLWYSDNPGAASPTWTRIPGTEGHPYTICVLGPEHLLVSYSASIVGGAFQATSGVVELTRDAAGNWQQTKHSAPGLDYWTMDVVVDPKDPTIWYACAWGSPKTAGGLYRKRGAGAWERLRSGATTSCALNPQNPDEMIVCTRSDGLWSSANAQSASPTFTRETSYTFRAPIRAFYLGSELFITSNGNGVHVAPVGAPPPPPPQDTVAPEVSFQDAATPKGPNAPEMSLLASLPAGSSNLTLPLRIRVADAGGFDVNAVTLEVRWTTVAGVTSSAKYAANSAGVWTTADAALTTFTITPDHTGQQKEVYFEGSLQLTSTLRSFTLVVSLRDLAQNATTSMATVDVSIPTDLVVLLDYSGSMRDAPDGTTKWSMARDAANALHTAYAALVRSQPGVGHRVGLVRAYSDGGAPEADATVVEVSPRAPNQQPLTTTTEPQRAYRSALGSGVIQGYRATLGAAGFRNRRLLLVSDGQEEFGTTLATLRAAATGDAAYVPNRAEEPALGCIIDTCSLGTAPFVAEAALQGLATGLGGAGKSYGGRFLPPVDPADPAATQQLTRTFLEVLAESLGVSLSDGVTDKGTTTFEIEDRVEEALFVVIGSGTLALTSPSGGAPLGAPGSGGGLTFWQVNRPAAGAWKLSGVDAPRLACVLLRSQVRATFDAPRAGLSIGKPIPLQVDLYDGSQPVSGADVQIHVVAPGESLGDVLSWWPRGRARASGIPVQPIDGAPTREKLLEQLAEYRPRLRPVWEMNVKLQETAAGRYEGQWTDTKDEGTYSFFVRAKGTTRGGKSFQRDACMARHLAPVPAPLSPIAWVPTGTTEDGRQLWSLSFTPRTVSGRRLGPGFGEELRLVVGDHLVPLTDHLDGSYSGQLSLPPGAPRPAVQLGFGDTQLRLDAGPQTCRRVRVVLERIRVKDDHESWFPAPGELVFDSLVAPNADPARIVRRRLPAEGHFALADGEAIDLDVPLFDGFVEEGASLAIALGGVELDDLLVFERRQPLARYGRVLTGELASFAGCYGPGDGPDDPESLADWEVTYRVEVL